MLDREISDIRGDNSLEPYLSKMVVAQKWILGKPFEIVANIENFKLEVETLTDDLQEGEVLCEAVFLTVDPFMRKFPTPVGSVMPGEQVAKITKSRNDQFLVGTYVIGNLGWRTHTIVAHPDLIIKIEDLGEFPLSLYLGALGMPGMTAYYGFLDGCKPKHGETVLVSSAAGAVGSLVAQIAKLKGCRVIGSTGTEEKCNWLKDELGLDGVVNYKLVKIEEALEIVAPEGIDCYFDNVGGQFTSDVIEYNMARGGRIACCGVISTLQSEHSQGCLPYRPIIVKLLTLKGVQGLAEKDRWHEGQKQMLRWLREGRVKAQETVTAGFANMPTAFLGLFEGANIGKSIVKV